MTSNIEIRERELAEVHVGLIRTDLTEEWRKELGYTAQAFYTALKNYKDAIAQDKTWQAGGYWTGYRSHVKDTLKRMETFGSTLR